MSFKERAARGGFFAAAAVAALSLALLLGFLLYFSAPVVASGEWRELFGHHWRPFRGEFGIAPMIAGSAALSLAALAVAFPLAIGVVSFANGVAPRPLARGALALLHVMTGIPTVVYGFVSVFLLVPAMRGLFERGSGFGLAAAALTLGLLVTPTVALVLESRLASIREEYGATAAALGFTPTGALRAVFLPAAFPALRAAALLGFGRALGDTLVALMAAGNAPVFPTDPAGPLRTLTSHIGLVVATDATSAAYRSLFAAGMLLFAVAVLVNLAARSFSRTPGRGSHARR